MTPNYDIEVDQTKRSPTPSLFCCWRNAEAVSRAACQSSHLQTVYRVSLYLVVLAQQKLSWAHLRLTYVHGQQNVNYVCNHLLLGMTTSAMPNTPVNPEFLLKQNLKILMIKNLTWIPSIHRQHLVLGHFIFRGLHLRLTKPPTNFKRNAHWSLAPSSGRSSHQGPQRDPQSKIRTSENTTTGRSWMQSIVIGLIAKQPKLSEETSLVTIQSLSSVVANSASLTLQTERRRSTSSCMLWCCGYQLICCRS